MLAAPVFVIAGALAVDRLAAPGADSIPQAEVDRRRQALAASLPLRLQAVAPDDIAGIVDGLDLTAAGKLALHAAIRSRSLHMLRLEVFDSDAEDGDVVRIETLGLTHTIRLTKRPAAVPIFMSSDGTVRVTGVDEGLGGGVTLGVISDGRPVKLPPLAAGETLVMGVAPMVAP